MERYDIEKLRSLSCEGVAQRLGISVKHHKALCCFHDDHTPSLTFRKNKFKCWSCGENGDSISFVMKVLGKDFIDACRWLADEHNVIVTSFTTLSTQKEPSPLCTGPSPSPRPRCSRRKTRSYSSTWSTLGTVPL